MNKSIIRKSYLSLTTICILLVHIPLVFAKANASTPVDAVTVSSGIHNSKSDVDNPVAVIRVSVYDSLKLGTLGLTRQAYEYAMKGYNYLASTGKLKNNQVISIVDFSQPSSKKRLFILDLKNYKLLFNTYVAHGRNSGREKATQFSNQGESYKSSLGFYITRETYIGDHGFSLKLEGEESGINDNAMSRAIVMHCADYVDESLIRAQGYIGRSLGCPAIPEKLHRPIIEKIKNGTCLFLYSPDNYYLSHSRILQAS